MSEITEPITTTLVQPDTITTTLSVGQGPAGVQGPTGLAGATGATGPQGPAGPATTDASLLVSGTLADARLSSNVALENVANVFTAKQSFSGTTHVGLCLHSLTTAQYNALTPANGDIYVDSTTNRVDVRLNGVTEELIDTRGGQTINGALAVTGNVTTGSQCTFGNGAVSGRGYYNTSVGMSVGSGIPIGWSSNVDGAAASYDVNISRSAAGVIRIGTTANNALGSLNLTNLTASGTINAQGSQDFFNGANYTRVTRDVGTGGRLRIYRPNSTSAIAVQIGGGNDELFVGQGGEGSFRAAGSNVQLGSTGAFLFDSVSNSFTWRGVSSTTMATLTGVGDLATVGTITYSSIAFPELVTNGTFATDTAWGKGAGWTISGGTAVATGVVSFADIQQNLPAVELGRTYIISFSVSVTSGSVQVFLGLSGSGPGTVTTINGSGTYSFLHHKSPADTTRTILFRGGAAFTGTIDNVSVQRAF